ncbi:hypothetical protein TNCV_4695291 [Trichonephila clavipes]|nr:hypothetical protein TNCV_4695291 [Trichonephila clavipes]
MSSSPGAPNGPFNPEEELVPSTGLELMTRQPRDRCFEHQATEATKGLDDHQKPSSYQHLREHSTIRLTKIGQKIKCKTASVTLSFNV